MGSPSNSDAAAPGSSQGDAQSAWLDAAAEASDAPSSASDAALQGSSDPTTADASSACAHCTGPGDWAAGDYPPDIHAQTYIAIQGVAGQGGAVRGYKVHVPASYDPTRPMPVLFAIHGLLQNAVMFAVDGAHWPEKADKEGFIVVMPTGTPQNSDGSWGLTGSWNAGECCGAAASSGVDDVALIRAILRDVGTHLNLDLGRVYATGLSNGGFLSYRLACEASDLFVAVAPAAGAIGTHELAPLGAGNQDFKVCSPTRPVAVLALHGTSDPLVPYAYYEPSLEHMAAAAGCTTQSVPAQTPASGGDTTCISFSGCPQGTEISGCSVQGGGHCWFGSPNCGTGDPSGIGNAVVGQNSNTLDDTEVVWAFLSRFSRL